MLAPPEEARKRLGQWAAEVRAEDRAEIVTMGLALIQWIISALEV